MNYEEGGTLIARNDEGKLVLEKQETIKQRLKDRFSHLLKNRSLANELIVERREEAQRESVN